MASKGPRSKLDHDTRARRQKALEAPREPPRRKTHWDHVLEEMVWLSKDFESERKWKLAQAKKVAVRASKGMLDHATRGEKKVKEEEQRLRKIALNISKDVKKFWMKIEKLVLYKHQLELEERKKKALDKQLDFLLGQTERYSTMLAENLVDIPFTLKTAHVDSANEQHHDASGEMNGRCHLGRTKQPEPQSDTVETDGDYGFHSEDESDDDEHTIEEDEALITEEERKEELAALQGEMDLPIEELLKHYANNEVGKEGCPENSKDVAKPSQMPNAKMKGKKVLSGMSVLQRMQEKLSEESASSVSSGELSDSVEEANDSLTPMLLENLSDPDSVPACKENLPVGQRIERNKELSDSKHDGRSNGAIYFSKDQMSVAKRFQLNPSPKGHITSDDEYMLLDSTDELDDETTLSEEEELAKEEANDPIDEIKLLQQESEMPVEELLKRYKKDVYTDEESQMESDSASISSDDHLDCSADQDILLKNQIASMDNYAIEEDTLDKDEEVNLVAEKTQVKLDNESEEGKEGENIIADAAAAARSAQPTGNTFLTTKVRTKFPFLLKHPLREYQHIGLDWLVTMYEKRLNGILADEMGLGKTIMTIALLAHLACEKGIWGPHLIVVPTSVMLNWETEFLKWCPAFKILTYFGSAKERKFKRQGWLKPNFFHVCITTYRLVIQDAKVFKRKKWKYLILDEAHLIKNWKSQRWQTLLNFNSKRRILLTGTPLQNDLMELWSLMHFLMPHIFQSHQEFKDWFSNPISGMVDGQEKVNKEVVDRLHNVLRPFILRRLKRDVEKQLPKKYEHVIYCRLSKRQRNLYEDFIASSETQATLASANFFGMISVIMQLRKVCNHPDLFEGRPIVSSFDMVGIDSQLSSSICTILSSGPFSKVDLRGLSFLFTHHDFSMTSWEIDEFTAIATPSTFIEMAPSIDVLDNVGTCYRADGHRERTHGTNIFQEIQKALWEERVKEARERAASIAWWNSLQSRKKPVYGTNLRKLVTIMHPVFDIHQQKRNPRCYMDFSSRLADIVLLPIERFQMVLHLIESFMFAIPAARVPSPVCWCSKSGSPIFLHPSYMEKCTEVFAPFLSPIRPAVVRRQVYFPDRRLIQFDCGKLQELAVLLRRLKSEGHRALIFTQMTKMLDLLEAFINLYGYTYMRLDGSTQPEERQTLMQRFNTNPKFFIFILSTRSGGVGINLVGADTVIFYDSDWNPAMDNQAQDRCHRIGQTREVHIYRLISESTIEENILRKANQKRALDDLVIQSGSYNTEFFKKLDPMELFSGHGALPVENLQKGMLTINANSDSGTEILLSNADVEAALKHVEDEADYMALKRVEQEEAVENQEFTEEAIGRLEDDEFGNEDDAKPDEKIAEEHTATIRTRTDTPLNGANMNEGRVLTLATREEDTDMLADVKQMAAAAAAAGQASSSFENQLRPIDRYAMRFLDLWDPIIDKSAIESQVTFEEAEWELDRIEKFKEDLEAEIDEDEEPLLYERWDADFATEAYRQQVEALARRQSMEEQESEAKETEDADDERDDPIRNEDTVERRPKLKKKTKKTKFKSLKKGALASESEALAKEPMVVPMSIDKKVLSPEVPSPDEVPPSPLPKKRKKSQVAPEEEKVSKKKSKKLKKAFESSPVIESTTSDKQHLAAKEPKLGEGMMDLDIKPANRSKMGGKVSITFMPIKRVLVIKPEKLKKKGFVWSKDCVPSPDSWSPLEDAMLCAIVHEYSTHWSLVSDALYGMTAGGFYRGRFRHPAHCCERFRELFSKYVLSTTDHPNNEKNSSAGSGKALLKVTEDHVRTLLDVVSEMPDNELLLQKHFTAILSSVWRANARLDRYQSMSSSQNSLHSRSFFSAISQMHGKSRREPDKMQFTALGQNCKLVAAALDGSSRKRQDPSLLSDQQEAPTMAEKLDVTLEFQGDHREFGAPFPPVIDLSVCGLLDPRSSADEPMRGRVLLDCSREVAEIRFRMASKACFGGESFSWATSAFPTCDVRTRPGSKSQALGKHKAAPDSNKPPKSKLPRTTEANEGCSPNNKMTPPLPDTASTNPIAVIDLPHFVESPTTIENYPFFTMDDSLQEMESFESLPYDYDPGLIMGLEDCKSLTEEITDIG